jgi:hypothetical protein
MHLLIASGLLDLGDAPSAFGVSLALILTFIVAIGGLANFLIGYAISLARLEHKENLERMREYDARHES